MVLAALPGCQKVQSKTIKPPPPVVIVSQPEWNTLTDSEDFTGRTEALRTVEVRARVTGYLQRLYFEDGSEVKEGAMLFEIDPRPYKAELDRAEGMLAQSDAHLKRLQADYGRATRLFSRSAIGQEEFDRVVGDLGEAKAAVDVARANRDLAKLNLDFTKVTASIPGRTSRRMVDPGNMVMANETALTTIVSLDPMYVYFDVDERTLLRLRRLVREGAIKTRSEAEVPVLAALADEEDFPHSGTIDFSDNKVDPNTGTLKLRGVLQNPAPRVLSPGLFVRVRLPIGSAHKSLIIAEQAIGTDQGRKFLYVVNDKGEVLYRPVKVGVLDNGMREIKDGLEPGEKVIVSGLQRVRPGAKVTAKFADDLDSDAAEATDKKTSGAEPLAKRETAKLESSPPASQTPGSAKQDGQSPTR
jgi:RND family efflux transporter MFP subunit